MYVSVCVEGGGGAEGGGIGVQRSKIVDENGLEGEQGIQYGEVNVLPDMPLVPRLPLSHAPDICARDPDVWILLVYVGVAVVAIVMLLPSQL